MQKHIPTLLSSLASGLLAVFLYTQLAPKQVTVVEREVIYTQFVNQSNNPSPNSNIDFVEPARIGRPAVVYITTKILESETNYQKNYSTSNASGVIISRDGYIVTNNHVIENADIIEVLLDDNRIFLANLIGADPLTDLALLKIEAEGLSFLEFGDSDELEVGEWILAIGNPFKLQSTVTAGIVSAKARNINLLRDTGTESFIQTDAAVNPGNSGGALINKEAKLVGINTAIYSKKGNFEGYSFAIPANLVKKVIFDIRSYGAVQRAWIGVTISNVNDAIAKAYGLEKPLGVIINDITINGAASDAGLIPTDIILKIDGTPTNSVAQLEEKLAQYRPGDILQTTYLHNGQHKTTKLLLKNQINTTDLVAVRKDKILQKLGFELRNLDQLEKNKLSTEGIKVISIYNNSIIDKANMEVGYIIQTINDQKVTNVSDLIKMLESSNGSIKLVGIYENFPGIYPYSFEMEQ